MAENFQFDSIDGGTMSTSDWRGQPVLVVNTASQCGFTYQYEALQQPVSYTHLTLPTSAIV